MLADAIAAENLRLTRNRSTLFWGFLFIPVLALVTQIIGQIFTHQDLPAELRLLPLDIAHQLVRAFGEAGGALTALLCLIGAAVLFTGDYRWETWRLLAPRAGRRDLFLAKVAVFAVWSLVTVVLVGALDSLVALVGGMVRGQQLSFGLEIGEFVRQWLSVTVISWLQILFAGGLAALAATATRSMIAAIMIPIGVMIGLAVAQSRYAVVEGLGDAWKILLIPGHAFEQARLFLAGVETLPGQTVDPALGWLGIASVVLWLVIGFGGGLAVFLRQDLSKE